MNNFHRALRWGARFGMKELRYRQTDQIFALRALKRSVCYRNKFFWSKSENFYPLPGLALRPLGHGLGGSDDFGIFTHGFSRHFGHFETRNTFKFAFLKNKRKSTLSMLSQPLKITLSVPPFLPRSRSPRLPALRYSGGRALAE